jgi:hypothetical protein
MRATIVLGVLVGLAFLAFFGEPQVLAEGQKVAQLSAGTQEPVWMVLSGASLLAIASLLRRHAP